MAKQRREALPDFWTDHQQAAERLSNSYILYENEPVHVVEVRSGDNYDDMKPRIVYVSDGQTRSVRRMDAVGFNKYRSLPILGWVNTDAGGVLKAVYLSRSARTTRTHGLNHGNTTVFTFKGGGGSLDKCREYHVESHFLSPYYKECNRGQYPKLEEVLLSIGEDSSIAYSNKFCVFRCRDGVRWLYRKKERIGLFTGADTLTLFPRLGFYREEIMEDPNFTVNNIQEF